MSSNNFIQGHSMKIKWLVADITAVGSPDRAERTILGVILAVRFCPIQTKIAVREPLSDVKTSSC